MLVRAWSACIRRPGDPVILAPATSWRCTTNSMTEPAILRQHSQSAAGQAPGQQQQPQGKESAQPSAATITVSATAAASASSSSAPPAHHVPRKGFLSAIMGGPRFQNPWRTSAADPSDKPLSDVMKFGREMQRLKVGPLGYLKGNLHPTADDFKRAFPAHPLTAASFAQPAPGTVAAVWLGHASVLLQMDCLTMITDPVFSERCSPVQFMGPRRVVPNLFHSEDPAAPHLDAVLISHNHYDHLDVGSVKRLHKRYGASLRWYVPLGLASWFRWYGITNVVELDWWQGAVHPGSKVEVTLTPAQHWSSRSGMDRRATLWGGWAVRGPTGSFWFAGDTGYCPVFTEIGERLGPFDLAAIPIGAYEPRWFMEPQHIWPEEAVAIHKEVRARHSMSIHCCTFYLTTEPLDEPPARLKEAVAAAGLAPDAFITLQHGARVEVAGAGLMNQPPKLPVEVSS